MQCIKLVISATFLGVVNAREKLLVLISDAATYMVKVGKNLSVFYTAMVHLTCIVHALHRVCATIMDEFDIVNNYLARLKQVKFEFFNTFHREV
jgi:hypothetical protein